ncbi:hypothetical protein Ancab_038799 [Ancistrocladus abbreviatus]
MAATAGHSLSSNLPFQDRVAIVTGCSHGVGKAIALHLASLGTKLVINYVSNSTLAQEVIDEINSSWSVTSSSLRAIVVQVDVSDPSQVKAIFDVAKNAFEDQAHFLIVYVGIVDPTFPSIANTIVEGFEKTLNVILKARSFAYERQQIGFKETVVAPSGLQDAPGCGAHLASTASVEEMTKIIAKELNETKITANCVGSGPIVIGSFLSLASEEMVEMCLNRSPLLRLGEPKDIAAVVGILVSDEGEWVNGQVISIHGGLWS